jgi:hypothetical protein
VIVAEDRRRIAAACAQFVFCDLINAAGFAVRSFNLAKRRPLGNGKKIQPGIGAVGLRTNSGVRVLVDIAKLAFRLEIFVGISGVAEMLRYYTDLGSFTWYRNLHYFLAPLKMHG